MIKLTIKYNAPQGNIKTLSEVYRTYKAMYDRIDEIKTYGLRFSYTHSTEIIFPANIYSVIITPDIERHVLLEKLGNRLIATFYDNTFSSVNLPNKKDEEIQAINDFEAILLNDGYILDRVY